MQPITLASHDGVAMDELEAFDAEIVALDTLLVRLMQERLDIEGDDRCDLLAAFTF